MKKMFPVVLITTVFGLIGCAANEKANVTTQNEYTTVTGMQKSKGKKCRHHGKFGVEKVAKDVK
ncbi:MAG: hypothetical protein LBL40_00220 [Coxiellaceae bacterium]|jgi:hypothetical protein|nr:hypothetical protein [Coxiellaceae bacterium]